MLCHKCNAPIHENIRIHSIRYGALILLAKIFINSEFKLCCLGTRNLLNFQHLFGDLSAHSNTEEYTDGERILSRV